jgi:hypothetical protein
LISEMFESTLIIHCAGNQPWVRIMGSKQAIDYPTDA